MPEFSKHIFLLTLTLTVFFTACKRDAVIEPPVTYDYFPVDVGHTIVYDFDSVFFDEKVNVADTVHLQLKEVLASTFKDNTNRTSYRIERFILDTAASAWKIKNVWYANRTTSTAERVESNQRYIKLVFPVKLNKTWKGNSFNTEPEWDYEYTSADEPYKVNNLSFDSTLTVTQVDELNLIERNYSVEKYARHVGLIYKEYIHIEKQPDGTVTKSIKYTYKIKSFQ